MKVTFWEVETVSRILVQFEVRSNEKADHGVLKTHAGPRVDGRSQRDRTDTESPINSRQQLEDQRCLLTRARTPLRKV
jgi:hypothetical protein